MRRTFLSLLFGLLLLQAAVAKAPDPYQIIATQAQAEAVMRDVQATMTKQFALTLKTPVQLHLVKATEMDKLLTSGPYKGAEIGLYTGVSGGKHQVYVMEGWGRDLCAGITAHELTHAWQRENANPRQDQVLTEGFAKWVEYKYYDLTGAYTLAQQTRETADPVYGVGFHAVLETEAAVGASKVADLMRRAATAADLPKKKTK